MASLLTVNTPDNPLAPLRDGYGLTRRKCRQLRRRDPEDAGRFTIRGGKTVKCMPMGGHPLAGHFCAGEELPPAAMKRVLFYLSQQLTYPVPAQDRSCRLWRLAPLPRSGFVRRREQHLAPVPTESNLLYLLMIFRDGAYAYHGPAIH